MATSPNFDPDDAALTQRNLRNRGYAKLLAQQAMQPVPQQSAGGWEIRTPQTALLAQVLNRMVALHALKDPNTPMLGGRSPGMASAPGFSGAASPGVIAPQAPPDPQSVSPIAPAAGDPAGAPGAVDPIGGWPAQDPTQIASASQDGAQAAPPDPLSAAINQELQLRGLA